MSVTLHTDFVEELVGITEVGEIVHPLLVPLEASLPAISYNFAGGVRESFYRGSFGLEDYTVTLDIYTDTYIQNQMLQDAIALHFNGFQGQLNSNTQVQRISTNSVLNSVDSDDTTIFRTLIEFQILA